MPDDQTDRPKFGPPWAQAGPGNWPQILQAGRGNIRPIILQALNEKPMHGYEIIRHFANRSHGHWKPSPGSVYPTLRKLEAENLIKGKQLAGKTKFHLTAEGRIRVESQASLNPWDGVKHPELLTKIGPLMREFMPLMHRIAMNGSEAQANTAAAIVEQATTKLKALNRVNKEKT